MKPKKRSSPKAVRKTARPTRTTGKTGSADAPPTPAARPLESARKPAPRPPARSRTKPAAAAKPAAHQPAAIGAPKVARPRPRQRIIPPLLLEGDHPPQPTAAGPGQRYVLSPAAPAAAPAPAPVTPAAAAALPESYGTQKLWLAARDPHWLCADWDLTRAQRDAHLAQSRDGQLRLRVYPGTFSAPPATEVPVPADARHWFVHVGRPGEVFVAQLGFYSPDAAWRTIATSESAWTPPDQMSTDQTTRFVTIPLEVPFTQVLAVARESVREHIPLVEVIDQLHAHGFAQFAVETARPEPPLEPTVGTPAGPATEPLTESPTGADVELTATEAPPTEPAVAPSAPHSVPAPAVASASAPVPAAQPKPLVRATSRPAPAPAQAPRTTVSEPPSPASATAPAAAWTPEKERALAAIIRLDSERRVWMGSLEITEMVRRDLAEAAPALVATQFPSPPPVPRPPGSGTNPFAPGGDHVSSPSTPFGTDAAESPAPNEFWFTVNAELVLYGATEPDARVTIGGKLIKLRSDGTFSYRFSLPDGQFELPAIAVSSCLQHGRAAHLRFSRGTHYQGEIGHHPQDPALKPPHPDHLA